MKGAGVVLAMIAGMIVILALLLQPRASLLDLKPETAAEITARVQAEEETNRAWIAATTEHSRYRTIGTISIAGIIVLGVAAWQWGKAAQIRAAQPPALPAHLLADAMRLLAEDGARRAEYVDGEWFVVDDAERALYPLARREQ